MEEYKKIGEKVLKERYEQITEPKDFLIYSNKWKRYFVNHDKVAEYIIDELSCKTIYGTKSEIVYTYDGRIFQPNGREQIKTMCETLLDTYAKTKEVNEIFEKIKRLTSVPQDYFDNTNINLIPLMNGVYNLQTKKLEEHQPANKFTFVIPQRYDENATCPIWLKFIEEALYPEDIPVLQEWFGFNLFRKYFIKKALIVHGEQDTGKSVLLDSLIYFIGEKNKTGIPLQKISSGTDFTKLSLKNKHANVYDDLSSADLKDGGGFKVATGGGHISGEEKFGDYQQFTSFAKQLFATNKIPPVSDNDDMAYFGRWIVLCFDNIPEKIDPFLRHKLWTEKEMSGVLNWALEGLFRILETGSFSYKKTPEQVKIIMEYSGCPLVAFSNDCLERRDGETITKDLMFQVYSVWAEENKKPRMSKEQLGRQLTNYCSYVLPQKHKERVWKNAIIKQEWLNKTHPTLSKISCLTNNNYKGIDINFKKVSEEPELNFEDSGI